MKSFVDNQGRTWMLNVNVGALKRVKALCNGLNLLNIIMFDEKKNDVNTDVLESLSTDVILLVDVLYAVCKPEADAQGISDEDFGASLSGDSIEYASSALLDAIVDFFPEAKRKVCQKILAAANRFADQKKQALFQIINNPLIDENIDSQLKKLNNTSMSAPEFAELIPPPSP